MGGGEVLRKGWLIKSPPLDTGGIKNWRKRYFRLRSSKILEYYKSEGGDLKGVINLEDCKSVNSDLFHKKYKYVFGIETHDRVYYLVASSSEEMTGWVDTLCDVCGFTLRPSLTPPDQPQSSKTMGNMKVSKTDAIISPPVSALAHNVSTLSPRGKFDTEESQSDVYSLATAAIYDVQTTLNRGAEVPTGTPLSDALTAKGIAPSPLNPIYSQSPQLPESAYFSPRITDSAALYSVPQKKSKIPKQHSVETVLEKKVSPTHRPLAGTQSDAVIQARFNEEKPPPPPSSASSSSLGYRSAETVSNGYMRPSQWGNKPRPANYDYVTGPPRPADGSTPPHRSALLRGDIVQEVPEQEGPGSPTYINMKELHNEMDRIEAAPQIDRSTKPDSTSPPRINRGLKPGLKVAPSECEELSSSPPNFPTRTGSISTPPILDASDLPKPTKRTMKYTQVQFDSSGQLSVLNDQDLTQRAPVPIPRGQNKKKRVNYSQIDLVATQATVVSPSNSTEEKPEERPISLNEAEVAALAEKPYINIARDGLPDDETDPDYYTHMRDLPTDSLLYVVLSKGGTVSAQNDEDLYQEPRETVAK